MKNSLWTSWLIIILPRRMFLLSILLTVLSCSANEIYFDKVQLEGAFRATVERGGLKDNGVEDASMTSYEQWIRSAYFIRTNGAHTVSIPVESHSLCYVYQYDLDHHLIAYDRLHGEVSLLKGCAYLRFSFRALNTPASVPLFFDDGKEDHVEEKKVQMSFPYDRLVYDVSNDVFTTALLMLPPNYSVAGESVPLIIWDSGDGSFQEWDTYEGGTYPGRLNGIRYLRDQGFAVLEIYSWGSYYFKKYPSCGARSAMPIPTHLATHEKGVEYVTSRYNIDSENIFHVSKSGSGKIALYYAMEKPSFNLRSIYAFAPVFDDLNFVGWSMKGYREALFEELGLMGTEEEINDFLEGSPYDYDVAYKQNNNLNISLKNAWQMHKELGRSFISKNAEKFKLVSVDWLNVEGPTMEELIHDTHYYSEKFWQGYVRQFDETQHKFVFSWSDLSLPAAHSDTYTRRNLIRKGSSIPFTVIMSPTDEQTPYWNALEVVCQLQNAGEDARMISLESGGHSGPDLSLLGGNVKNNVTTRLGIQYESVSIGWYLTVEDIYDRFLAKQ